LSAPLVTSAHGRLQAELKERYPGIQMFKPRLKVCISKTGVEFGKYTELQVDPGDLDAELTEESYSDYELKWQRTMADNQARLAEL
jgi:hypothetical protein